MQSVRVLVSAERLVENMRDIQQWLDQTGFAVARYNYGMEEVGRLIEVDIEFPLAEEAEIFCCQFEDKLLCRKTAP